MTQTLTVEYVHRFKTKSMSRGWKVVCPSCGGRDLWYTEANGTAFCFECGSTYRVGERSERQRADTENVDETPFDVTRIRELYAEAHSVYRSNLTKDHKEYLKRRGIEGDAIDTFGIGYCSDQNIVSYTDPSSRDAGFLDNRGRPSLAGRVVFPYIADQHVTDMRGRAVENIEPKYRSLAHGSTRRGAIFPFNYERAMNLAREQKTVIITEGEIKAAVADIHGFPCMGLSGMLSWRPGFIVEPGIRVILAFDSNKNPDDRRRVDRALARINQRVPDFGVVSLPLLGEDKMDIDYFLLHKQGGYQRFKHLVDSAVPYTTYVQLRRF